MEAWIRQQALNDLRGYSEPLRPDASRLAGDVVGEVMKKLGLRERLDEVEVRAAWKEIVGEFLATHSHPHSLRAGVLYVNVLQPVVHYELDRSWRPKILAALKERFGARTIRDVRLRLG